MNLNLRSKDEPEVNLTSLIDVVLLLLVFFMVSTSFVKQSQISIRLPEAESAPAVVEEVEHVDIMITEQGAYSSTVASSSTIGRRRCVTRSGASPAVIIRCR